MQISWNENSKITIANQNKIVSFKTSVLNRVLGQSVDSSIKKFNKMENQRPKRNI
jgi:hypothetical protein